MSGPIVRSGASPEFSKNWDRIFGNAQGKKQSAKQRPATPKKSAKKKSSGPVAPAGKKAVKKKPAKKK
jgi:hypothetical protein